MREIKLNTMYSTNEEFREFVDKCARTYKKTVDEVLQMQTTKEYALYLIDKGANDGGEIL